jgi:3-hydroxyacyl-CoA dehydrogenase/3a,7a,12a-trihydroxy-5b-cholest-24-enoyl-CoA hydratase
MPDHEFMYTAKDAIVYALGVGVSLTDTAHLKFLYEGHMDFSVLPTFAVIPALHAVSSTFLTGQFGDVEVNPAMILHGEHYLEVYKRLPDEAALLSTTHIADILDKKTAAVIIFNVETSEMNGTKVAFNQFSFFVRGIGGFGGSRSSNKLISSVEVPTRPPCVSVQQKTSIDQAAVYRLSGDTNPLHIDPSFATLGGFSVPILHGLCSFGFAGRHILEKYCNNDVTKLKAIKVRFSNPVIPGQTLSTDMWKNDSQVHMQCKIIENGQLCLTEAFAKLNN